MRWHLLFSVILLSLPLITACPTLTSATANNLPLQLSGPGFKVTLPAGFVLNNSDALPGSDYHSAYWLTDAGGDIKSVSLIVLSSENSANEPLEEFTLRIKGAAVTLSGDFFLVTRGGFSGTDREGDLAIGKLADGRLFSIGMTAERFDARAEAIFSAIIRSIDLADTDGKQLEAELAGLAPRVTLKTREFLVLSDLTGWILPESPPGLAVGFSQWQVNDPVFWQVNQDTFFANHELIKVGEWIPSFAQYGGLSEVFVISRFRAGGSPEFSNGLQLRSSFQVPSDWQVGDQFFTVAGKIVHARTGISYSP